MSGEAAEEKNAAGAEALKKFLDSMKEAREKEARRIAALTPGQRAEEARRQQEAKRSAEIQAAARRLAPVAEDLRLRDSWTIDDFAWLLTGYPPNTGRDWGFFEGDESAKQRRFAAVLQSCVGHQLHPLPRIAGEREPRYLTDALLGVAHGKQLEHWALLVRMSGRRPAGADAPRLTTLAAKAAAQPTRASEEPAAAPARPVAAPALAGESSLTNESAGTSLSAAAPAAAPAPAPAVPVTAGGSSSTAARTYALRDSAAPETAPAPALAPAPTSAIGHDERGNFVGAPADAPATAAVAPAPSAGPNSNAAPAKAGTLSRERKAKQRQKVVLALATELLESERGHREDGVIVLYLQSREFLQLLAAKDIRWARTSERTLARDRDETVPKIRFQEGRPMMKSP